MLKHTKRKSPDQFSERPEKKLCEETYVATRLSSFINSLQILPSVLVAYIIAYWEEMDWSKASMSELKMGVAEFNLHCVKQIRNILAVDIYVPIQEMIDGGLIPKLVECLSFMENPILQIEAAWALTNITTGTTQQTKIVVEAGAIPLLVKILGSSSNDDALDHALWVLANIVGDSSEFRDLCIKAGVLAPTLTLLQQPLAKATLLRRGAHVLANLVRQYPLPDLDVISKILPTFRFLIGSKDEEVLAEACWGLSYIAADDKRIQNVVETGVCRRLVELLLHKQDNVKAPALLAVGNIVKGNEDQKQSILNFGALPCLLALLAHRRESTRKNACWTVSNITAGNQEQIELVIKANLFPPLISTLRTAEFDIQKQAGSAIVNALNRGNDDQIRYLAAQGASAALVDILRCTDSKFIKIAMSGIEKILQIGARDAVRCDDRNKSSESVEYCRGIETLRDLLQHEDEGVYVKADELLKVYFRKGYI